MRVRLIAVAIAVALLVGACGGGSSKQAAGTGSGGGRPAAAAAPKSLDEWLARTATPSDADLLRAYALAFGPVPGVVPLAFPKPGVGTRTALVAAVRARFAKYTKAQQDAIEKLANPVGDVHEVRPPTGARPGKARAAINSADAEALVGRAIGQIENHTGFAYTRPIVVNVLSSDNVEGDDTWAEAIAHEPGTPFIGIHPWSQAGDAADAECVVFIGQAVASAGDPTAYEKIAHEVFHCFQYAAYRGTIFDFGALPAWLVEGSAAWAGLSLAGGPHNAQSDTWWAAYFNPPASGGSQYSLMAGSGYHAVGFFSYLDGAGVDVWHQVLPALNAGTAGRAFAAITGDSEDTMAAWSSAAARTAWSAAWQMRGPGIIDAHRDGEAIDVVNGTDEERTIPNLSTQLEKLAVGSAEYMVADVAGPSTMSWNGEADIKVTGSLTKRYCFLSDCNCPDGSAPFGGAEFEQHERGALTVGNATTSDPRGGDVHVVGLSKEDACRCRGESGSGGGGPGRSRPRWHRQESGGSCDFDPCLTGTWTQDNNNTLALMSSLGGPNVERHLDGATTLTFAPPVMTVHYGQTATGVDRARGMTITQTFSGESSSHYRAVAGLLSGVPPVNSGGRIHTVVAIRGISRDGGEQPFDSMPADATHSERYQCSPHTLTVSLGSRGNAVYHR